MALGDGIRRNLATVSKEERDLFIDAIKQLNHVFYPGSRTDFPAGGVSYWFKQDEIHQSSHVHGCPAFLPWHRELCNRFETLLRTIHPALSLHYWDWNLDPSNMPDGEGGVINLFDQDFMGNADGTVNEGSVGQPLLGAGFYLANPSDPDPVNGQFRDDISPVQLIRPNPNDPSTWSYPAPGSGRHYNPADPPKTLTRDKPPGGPGLPNDSDLVTAGSWETFSSQITAAHNAAHGYIGGNLGDPHLSFRDPFVFLLHANIDRLWAMWQRQPNHPERLSPDQVYNTEGNTTGNGDVEFGDPYWGILSPLEPWAGFTAQTNATGIVTNIWPIRPWYAPDNEAGNNKTSKDLSVVLPPSYDTAPHSSYVVANQDTFSNSQAAVNLTFSGAFYVIYEGFQPREIGTPTASNPSISFAINGVPNATITAANPRLFLEDPNGAQDVPQRVSILYDIVFSNLSAFPAAPGDETAVSMQASLNYTVGGTTVQTTDKTSAVLLLVNQPAPYMTDIDATIPPPGPPNPYWLSADTRVFQIKQGDSIAGIQQQTDPFGFVTNVVTAFNALPNDNNHPFLAQLSPDENASRIELSPTVGGTNVYNYAIAKIRYRGNVPAQNVSVFFRAFKTVVSALDYDHTTGPAGNYRRSGNAAGSVPLLGIQSNEIASIPFFAVARVDTATQSMNSQPEDPINTQISFQGNGQEEVVYCGVWLDINDIGHPRFPLDPSSNAGGVDGPYSGPLLTIQQLVTGLHYCLVAEIFFWPSGAPTDPIPIGSTPVSSDRLAQRNLAFDQSGNPGWPATHTVEHTFLVKPSVLAEDPKAAGKRETSFGPDELMISWGNIPRASEATLFFPEVSANEILAISRLRQHPATLAKVDEHTISIRVADMSFVPLPARRAGNLAGLFTLRLPQGVRVGQTFKLNVQQSSGISIPRRARHILGAFQFNISVTLDSDLLAGTKRKLSLLRHIHRTIPPDNRWHPIFVRWLDRLAAKITALGGDPALVLPSPTGGDMTPVHRKPPCEINPRELCCLNVPWDECDIEGEIDVKLRFRKKLE